MRLPFPGGLIRPWRPADAKPLVPLADDRGVWLNLRDRFPHPYRPADARYWIKLATAQKPQTHFAVEADGKLAGAIGLMPGEDVHCRSAELGYWLGRPFWGRGLMTAAVRTLTDRAFEEFGLCRIFALVFEWNGASMRVLEKAGYVLEGRHAKAVFKDGKLADEYLYAKVA